MPLAPDKGTFTWADVQHVIARTTSGRVPDPLGAIVVESPVRRLSGELFDRTEMMRVCAEARRLGIGLHLDGARLFIASAYTGISPAEYAAPFDTVYVSLWKYFNSLNGAILAGPSGASRRDVPRPAHVRRRTVERLAVRLARAPLRGRIRRSVEGGNCGVGGLHPRGRIEHCARSSACPTGRTSSGLSWQRRGRRPFANACAVRA